MGNTSTTNERGNETMTGRKYFRVGLILETGKTKWIWATDRKVHETASGSFLPGSISYLQVKRDGDQEYDNGHRMMIAMPSDIAAEKPAMMDNHYGWLVIQ
jgi:hypothetical protein